MRFAALSLALLLGLLNSTTANAQILSVDFSETPWMTEFGATGTPDLYNESMGTDLSGSTVSLINMSGLSQTFQLNLSFMQQTLYGNTPGIMPNSTDEGRIQYEPTNSNPNLRFSSAWDASGGAPGAGEGHTGDLRTVTLEVLFTDFTSNSEDTVLDLSSLNTAGQAYESSVVQFLDSGGNLIGTDYTYNGFWVNAGDTANIDSDPAGGSDLPGNVTSDATTGIYSTDIFSGGSMSFIAGDVDTVDFSGVGATPDEPLDGSSGGSNSPTVTASNLVGSGVELGGFRIIRLLEDVALLETGFATGIYGIGEDTSTSTTFTSALFGFDVTATIPEPTTATTFALALCGLGFYRRRQRA